MRGIGLGLASICAGFASITSVLISSIRFNLRSSTVAKSCSETTAVTASLGASNGKQAIAARILVVIPTVGFRYTDCKSCNAFTGSNVSTPVSCSASIWISSSSLYQNDVRHLPNPDYESPPTPPKRIVFFGGVLSAFMAHPGSITHPKVST